MVTNLQSKQTICFSIIFCHVCSFDHNQKLVSHLSREPNNIQNAKLPWTMVHTTRCFTTRIFFLHKLCDFPIYIEPMINLLDFLMAIILNYYQCRLVFVLDPFGYLYNLLQCAIVNNKERKLNICTIFSLAHLLINLAMTLLED